MVMIPQAPEHPGAPFPDTDNALTEPDGLLAWGGDLSPPRLLNAYRNGIFPWFSEGEPILWWSPARRCVFPSNEFHVSRSLRKCLRQRRYNVTADQDFSGVIQECADRHGDTWITADMIVAYTRLHESGHAHSIEVWNGNELAGGLYGLSLGRFFFAESMFSAGRDASKVAMAALCSVLDDWEFPLLDAQIPNPHLLSLGAKIISRQEYLRLLETESGCADKTGSWTGDFELSWQSGSRYA